MDVTEFLDQHRATPTPFQRAMAAMAAADAKADARDGREEAQRQAAAQHRAETLALANRQSGGQLAELARYRVEAAAADDLVRDLADQLAKATAKRTRIGECIRGLTLQLDEITSSMSRSAPWAGSAQDDLLAPARRAHAEFAAATRAAMSEAATSTRARPPFISRGAGQAIRSEHCIHCSNAGVDDETSYLLHSDPELDCPVTTPEQWAAEQAGQPVQAEYRSELAGRTPMIYR